MIGYRARSRIKDWHEEGKGGGGKVQGEDLGVGVGVGVGVGRPQNLRNLGWGKFPNRAHSLLVDIPIETKFPMKVGQT